MLLPFKSTISKHLTQWATFTTGKIKTGPWHIQIHLINVMESRFCAKWCEKQREVSKAFDMDKHEHHKVWKCIHDISEKPKDASSNKTRMLNGDTLNSSEDLLKEWAKYFSILLNNKSPKTNPNNCPLPTPDIPGI